MKFTKDHEWVRLDGDVATVGISKHAADALGDVVFVETPEAGKTVSVGDSFAVVESVKAASDVYAPIAGEVIDGSGRLRRLSDHPLRPAVVPGRRGAPIRDRRIPRRLKRSRSVAPRDLRDAAEDL